MTRNETKQLMLEIDQLRQKMYAIRLKGVGFTDPQLIYISTELDRKINQFQYLLKKEHV